MRCPVENIVATTKKFSKFCYDCPCVQECVKSYGLVARCPNEFEVARTKKPLSVCLACDKLLTCVEAHKLEYRAWKSVNVKLNTFDTFGHENVVYNEPRKILTKCYNLPDYNRCPRMEILPDGTVRPVKTYIDAAGVEKAVDSVYTVREFQVCLRKSAKRTYDNFFGYALSNDWEWFFTFTFDKAKIDRYDYTACCRAWSKFLEDVKKKDPQARAVVVSEQHEDGAWHFHGFFSSIRDSLTLSPAINPKTGKQRVSKCGDLIFNVSGWPWGFSTACVLPADCNRRKVVNYCVKYLTKSCDKLYRKKKFHRTQNLQFKTVVRVMMTDFEKETLQEAFGFTLVKENKRVKVYRV